MKNYVTIKEEVVEEALTWAKEHCPSYITNIYHPMGNNEFDTESYDFFFAHNATAEMTMFALKWA